MSARLLPFTPARPRSPLDVLAATLQIDSLIITPDKMPGHYVARAWILDLQPSQTVAAICAVEDAIRKTYPRMHRSGWRASADGLYLYFYAWMPAVSSQTTNGGAQ